MECTEPQDKKYILDTIHGFNKDGEGDWHIKTNDAIKKRFADGLRQAQRFIASLQDAGEIDWKPLRDFCKYQPEKGPAECLRDEVMQVENIKQHVGPHVEELIKAATRVMRNKVDDRDVLVKNPGLTENGVFAIAVFTLELQNFVPVADEESEFFFQYGEALRTRAPASMKLLAGYSHYLFTGLKTMPAFEGELWRGIRGADAVQKVTENYKEGKKIRWSAFSSGTTNRQVAKNFVTASGILLKIRVRTCAHDIRQCSAMPAEEERLILPNSVFFITGTGLGSDGTKELYMMEADCGTSYIS